MKYSNIIIFLGCLALVACSSSSSPYSRTYSGGSISNNNGKTKSSLPRVPPKILPGGDGDNWRYLGTTDNGVVGIEINNDSISIKDNNRYTYQDRKTIIVPNSYAFNGMPSYRYSLSWWQMDCNAHQYQITSTAIYDTYGKPIKSYNFNQVQSSNVTSGSISEAQYNYICNNYKKNVGY